MLFDNIADPYQLNNLTENPNFSAIAKNLDVLLSKELNRLDDEFLPGTTYIEKWGYKVDATETVPYVN